MNIGNLKLKNRLFLAPMHDVNDIAFRELCMKNGCALTYTWLIHPLSREKMDFNDRPAIQIATSSDKGVKEFIKKNEKNAKLFDLNLGCPALRARGGDYGAYLQRNPRMVEKILKIMRNSTKLPITVKIRKSPHVSKLLPIFEKYCDAIAVHPRTAEQGYSGLPDLEFAEYLKKKTSLPIIYSGDADEANVQELLKKFDFVMIGRKAIGNPGIFAKLSGKKPFDSFNDYLKLAKKHKLDFSAIKMQAIYFTKGKKDASRLRHRISKAKNINDLKKTLSI